MATEEEAAQLKLWKTYRVQLNRINPQDAPEIDWPVAPGEEKARSDAGFVFAAFLMLPRLLFDLTPPG